jgi:hypothetical protein
MRTIYELDSNKIWTGNTKQITEKQGRPKNWIVTDQVPPNGIARWNNGWDILDEYPQPPQPSITEKQNEIRKNRNQLLQDTDWVIIKSIEAGVSNLAQWKAYRQALRDITAQPGFPNNVTWPTKPE